MNLEAYDEELQAASCTRLADESPPERHLVETSHVAFDIFIIDDTHSETDNVLRAMQSF